MTGWNLPPGCEVSDLPGNQPDQCDACGLETWPDDLKECPKCEQLFCEDCYDEHVETCGEDS